LIIILIWGSVQGYFSNEDNFLTNSGYGVEESYPQEVPIPNAEKRSFDFRQFGGIFEYFMRTIYAITAYPRPYPAVYGFGHGQGYGSGGLLNKFGPGSRLGYYGVNPGSYSAFYNTRGYGFH
jgi:hypothetical protein